MDPNVLAAIIAVSVAMLGGFAALWRRRNGNGRQGVERHSDKGIDPESSTERTGEMSVAFWQRRFDDIEEKLDAIVGLLGRRDG